MALDLKFSPAIGPITGARLKQAGRNACLSLERIELLGQSRRIALGFIEAERRGLVDAFLIRVDWEALHYISMSPVVPVYPTPESFKTPTATPVPIIQDLLADVPLETAIETAQSVPTFEWATPKVTPARSAQPAAPAAAANDIVLAEWEGTIAIRPSREWDLPSRDVRVANVAVA